MKTLKFFSLTLMMAIYILSASAQKIADNNIGKITTAYLSMKNALVENDGTTAKVKANELYTLLASQPDKGLKLKQSKLLAIYLEPLLDNTRPICKTIDENEQRGYLSTLSKNMFELLKGLKLNTLTIYEQYCPIKDAYWLSETAVIKNPYDEFHQIASCGKTVAVLPPSTK